MLIYLRKSLIFGFMEPISIVNNCTFLIKPVFKVTDYIQNLKRLVGEKGDVYIQYFMIIMGGRKCYSNYITLKANVPGLLNLIMND